MPRHFDRITLRLFIAACEEHNIARAAERAAIVASAVSKSIAQIENEIGTPLLLRGRRGIEPPAAGGMMESILGRQAVLAGQTMNHRIQVSSLDAACRIVAASLGLAILPREAIEPHAAASLLRLLPQAEPRAHRRFVIGSRPEGLPSASTRLPIDHLRLQASGAH